MVTRKRLYLYNQKGCTHGRHAAHPSYCLHKPSGRAIVKVKGKIIYLGAHDSPESREEYARIVADILAGRPVTRPQDRPAPTAPAVRGITVGELAEKFQAHADGYYLKNGKRTSEPAAIRCAMKFFSEHHRDLPAAEFTIGDLKVVRQAMIDAGHCRNSVNKNVRRIRLAFRWGATEGLVPPAIPQALTLLPGLKAGRTEARESKPIQPVDDETIAATVAKLSPTVGAMVELQRATGMRPDEVCQVRPVDIDRSGDVWVYRPQTHKTQHAGRERLILIGPKGQDVLRPFLLRPENEYCFRPDRHVAVPRAQKRYRIDSYRQAIERACDRAFPAPEGLEGDELKAWRKEHRWSPNRLRHTFATAARAAYGLEAAQVLLGHSRADVTQVYAERDVAKGIEAARAIG